MLLNVISSLCEIKNRQVLSIAVSCIASIYTQENLQVLVMGELIFSEFNKKCI